MHLKAIAGTAELPAGAFATNDELVEIARGEISVDEAKRQWLIDLYDAEIRGVDTGIGALLGELERRGVLENAVIGLVSDHGEEFGEHGGWFHALTLHRESLAVPLVFRDTRTARSGARIGTAVDLVDVPTTLLALAGVQPDPGMHGRPLLKPGALAPRDLVAELHPDPEIEDHIRPRTHRFALTRWPWKAIVDRDRTRHIYRVDRDFMESTAMPASALPPALDAAALSLANRLVELDPGTAEPIEAEVRDGLRALGYVE